MSCIGTHDSGFTLDEHPDRIYFIKQMEGAIRPQYIEGFSKGVVKLKNPKFDPDFPAIKCADICNWM
jgi:hypothetical protein